ncbi:hypothetical protein EVAR_89363_1 [Eumeta japonica]|uniref:Uncharacterized protein n=1 Tax=Eumeta variegata TaxID=151549 RepID=A0A4C1ZSU1_EUMVA|nr:hypothetical protein EVAR_89363_1 [Eumeta japonica]
MKIKNIENNLERINILYKSRRYQELRLSQDSPCTASALNEGGNALIYRPAAAQCRNGVSAYAPNRLASTLKGNPDKNRSLSRGHARHVDNSKQRAPRNFLGANEHVGHQVVRRWILAKVIRMLPASGVGREYLMYGEMGQ